MLGLLLLVPQSSAQAPTAAGYSPVINIGAGYSYANVPVPSRGSLNMSGIAVTGSLDLSARIGLEVDVSYVRSQNVFGTSHSADLFTYMGGPVFYLRRAKHLNIYCHALLGAARETGVNFNNTGGLLSGYVNRFAWAAGGGAEYKLDRNVSLRFGGDYLNTQFFDPAITFKHQNDVQAFIGFSYRFGGRRR